MKIKTLDELRQADERTQAFTPYGLGHGTPEAVADFQQRVVGQFDLAPSVADGIRQSFERLQIAHAYGVLCYDLFTLVHDHALLVIEQALRERFMEYHDGVVRFIDEANNIYTLTVTRYDDVHKYASKRANRNKRLLIGDGPKAIDFNGGMLAGLWQWARAAGLLHGQRNRQTEQALSKLRNYAAHPSAYELTGPVDAAHNILDLAEIINRLWGHLTPGGRLYPTPIHRDVLTLAWPDDGSACVAGLASQLANRETEYDSWKHVIIRASREEPEIHRFQSRYEATAYPSEWLWGPGSRHEAAAWFEADQPAEDECEYLDRVFVVRHDRDQLYLTTRPDVAAVLPEPEQAGLWYILRADYPNDAYGHVRNRVRGVGCQNVGACNQCHVELLGNGSYNDVQELIEANRADLTYTLEPHVATPMAGPHSYTIS